MEKKVLYIGKIKSGFRKCIWIALLAQSTSVCDKHSFFGMELNDIRITLLKKHDPVVMFDEDYFEHNKMQK